MPEKKKVTISPGTKQKDNWKNNRMASQKRDGSLSRTLNPIQRSKENIKRSYDVRRTREKYGDKIQALQEEQDNDIRDLEEQIRFFRKDNEKLIRQQTQKFGLTLDEMDTVKVELEDARDLNENLYRQVEIRKEECDKLQCELDNLLERTDVLAEERRDLKYEQRVHEAEILKLQRTENKIQELLKSNRELRAVLLHHKLDPNVDAETITPYPASKTVKTASPKNKPTRVYQESADSRFPVIYTKRNLMGIHSGSADDVRHSKKSSAKQHSLRRTRSYNQSAKQFMTPQDFLSRRKSDSFGRTHHFEVIV